MAIPTSCGVPLSTLNPKFLHSNSTSHTWPFGAIAELIDNAFDPDVQAKQFWIDKTVFKGQDCLVFMDNGKGLVLETMHKMLSFGHSDKSPANGRMPIGRYGNGFKSGSMRLGRDAIIFSKSESTSCIGMLSQTYLEEIKAEQIVVPIVSFGHTQTNKFSVQEEQKNSLQAILRYSPFTTQEMLLTELDAISPPWSTTKTGTRIIIWNLRRTSSGSLEFDFEKDRYDIRLPKEVYEGVSNTSSQPDRVASYIPKSLYSLRAYCSILYLKPRMKIIIRGLVVKTELIAKSLASTRKDSYTPTFLKRSIPITFGYNPKNKDHYGIMMYHKNRLIKAYERVGCQLKANSEGVGVIGVVECNFLQPSHNKQSFDDFEKYKKIMHNLGIKLMEYWKQIRYTWKKENPNSTTPVEDTMKRPDQNWVQCDGCSLWRKLPDGIDVSKLPDKWFCHLNPDPQYRSCLEPEEHEDSDDGQPTYSKTYKQQEREDKKQQEKKRQKDEEDRRLQEVQRLANLAIQSKARQQEALKRQQLQKIVSSPHTPTTTTRSRFNAESQKRSAETAKSSPLTSSTISAASCSTSSNSGLPVISNVCSLSPAVLRGKRTQPATPQRTPKRPRASVVSRNTPGTPSSGDVDNDDEDKDANDNDDDIVILEHASTPKPKNPCFDLNKVKTEQEPDDADVSMLSERSDDAAMDVASETNAARKSSSPSPAPPPELTSTTTQTEVCKVKKEEEDKNQTERKCGAEQSTADKGAGLPTADDCDKTCSPFDHRSISELQEQQDELLEIMQMTAQERDSFKEQVYKLTCQLQDTQSRVQELSRINVKKECFHQASQTEETEETEGGSDYKTLFEKAKQKIDELIKDKEAVVATAETKPSNGQGEERDDEIALQVDFLLRELDQRNKEKDELCSQLDSLKEERAQLAAQCEELRLSLQQQRQDAQEGGSAPQRATDSSVQKDTEEAAGTAASTTDSSSDTFRSLIELRQNTGRLLLSHVPALDLGQVNYECNVIDEILEQVLSQMDSGEELGQRDNA